MSHYELVHTELYDGFTVNLYTTWEDMQPDWDFESEEDKQEVLDKINNGSLLWFVAKVTASKNGIQLAEDYLGGCCYEYIKDFTDEVNGCYADMRERVTKEAKEAIIKLTTN